MSLLNRFGLYTKADVFNLQREIAIKEAEIDNLYRKIGRVEYALSVAETRADKLFEENMKMKEELEKLHRDLVKVMRKRRVK